MKYKFMIGMWLSGCSAATAIERHSQNKLLVSLIFVVLSIILGVISFKDCQNSNVN